MREIISRIVYISNSRIPTEKANGYQVMKMCEAFGRMGISTELVYPFRFQSKEFRGVTDVYAYYGAQRVFGMKRLWSFDLLFLDPYIPRGLRYFLKPSLVQAFSFAFSSFVFLLRYFWDSSVVIYGRDQYTFLLLAIFSRFIKCHVVYEAHVFPGRLSKRFVLWMIKRIHGVVVVTHALQDRYVAAGVFPEKIFTAHDGVDVERFSVKISRVQARERLGLPQEPLIIGYVGRFQTMGMEKGIMTLIEVLSILKRKILHEYQDGDLDKSKIKNQKSKFRYPSDDFKRRIVLYCVGGPMDVVRKYKEKMNLLGLSSEDVVFVDRRLPQEMPCWIRACDVVTIPFPRTEHMAYYASPMKLFEYMAVGTPIVASRLPALEEVLKDGENALLAEPGDAESFANAIQSILGDVQLALRLGAAAQRDVRFYSWDERANSIAQFVIKSNRNEA